jgi:3-oxoacyl-[acyl-carrier protein] reductase
MADTYGQLVRNPLGRLVAGQVGLPVPAELERHRAGAPVISGEVLLGAAAGGGLARAAAGVLAAVGAGVRTPHDEALRAAAADAGLEAGIWNAEAAAAQDRFKALVFDASGIDSTERLREAWAFFHPTIRRVLPSGRVIILARPPAAAGSPPAAVAQRALEGLMRSIGKEVRGGCTAQLIQVAPGAEEGLGSTLRFFLSPKSAYVSGQVVRLGAVAGASAVAGAEGAWDEPLSGRIALVTGAARGIGLAIAEILARDGAHVVGLDVPALGEELAGTARRLGGSALTLDITEETSPERIAQHLLDEHGGVDIVVHNAGITRDKTLGRMSEELWEQVLAVNLLAPQRIERALHGQSAVRRGGRVICVSSISGIAGNAGQTNYATSKAGVIGLVEAWAPALAEREVTLNAVAPGFIETRMTAQMPIATREAGRRMNSLLQGGLPVDVAETVAWLADPGSGALSGNVVRVCGQSLLGA